MSKNVAKLTARIETLRAQLAKAEAALAGASTLSSVNVGDVVEFKFGRGESVVVKQGVVLGSKVAENGVTLLAVEIGEGFDKQVARVPATAVVNNLSAPAVAPEAAAE